MDIVMGIWIDLVIAIAAFAALMAILSFANKKPTTESNVADDRWFTITQWMDEDKKWKDSVGKTIDEMADTLDALYAWTDKIAGQLERIEGFCNLDAYKKTFVTVPANAKAKQGDDGLVWFDKQPEEPGYYWFTGTWDESDGAEEGIFAKVSPFVVTYDGSVQIDLHGVLEDDACTQVKFTGWWAKMDVPEFKGGDK